MSVDLIPDTWMDQEQEKQEKKYVQVGYWSLKVSHWLKR